MPSYKDWTDSLSTTKDEQYWDNIVYYSKEIKNDLEIMKAYKVAEKLNMPSTTLSYIKPLVFAIADADADAK